MRDPSLAEQLAKFRENFEAKAPSDAVEFTLPDADGNLVSSTELLRNGPLVVSFFRGKW